MHLQIERFAPGGAVLTAPCLNKWLKEKEEELIQLTEQLAAIPSPSGQEGEKAFFVRNYLEGLGCQDVSIDEAGNVLYPWHCGNRYPVYSAHIDTVFGGLREIHPRRESGRLYAPSVGDNSVNVAGLLMLIKLLQEWKIQPDEGEGVLFALNTGEEGLGNLRGIRQIVADRRKQIDYVVALDLGGEKCYVTPVGSKRYNVTVRTEGGHSYGAFGNRNAIAALARLIDRLYAIQPPSQAKTTYNVGLITGGTSVNTIAQEASMTWEIRSESPGCLAQMDHLFLAEVDALRGLGDFSLEVIGERPCGQSADVSFLKDRVERAFAGAGQRVVFASASTDCNLPMSVGIPAVSFGVCKGVGAHTEEEYILLDTLLPGMEILLRFFFGL